MNRELCKDLRAWILRIESNLRKIKPRRSKLKLSKETLHAWMRSELGEAISRWHAMRWKTELKSYEWRLRAGHMYQLRLRNYQRRLCRQMQHCRWEKLFNLNLQVHLLEGNQLLNSKNQWLKRILHRFTNAETRPVLSQRMMVQVLGSRKEPRSKTV